MVDAGSTDSMLAILEKLKRDHAETEQLLALREHERRVRASNLSERHDAIAKAEAEIDDIVRKTQQSAGNAQQLDESIKSDLGEKRTLDEEVARLDRELGRVTGELEAQQAREVARSLEAAAEWPSLRSASREKYRADNASVARRAAELKLLEEEAVARPSGWVEQPEAAMDVEPCEPGVVSSSEC